MKLPTICVLCSLTFSTLAANWPQWRGPHFNGSSDETGLPTHWSAMEHIAWKAALPGISGATPVIWEESVFVSSPDEQKNLLLICINRRDGSMRWQKIVATGDRDQGRNNMASPSPVTDGKVVVALYGTGDLAAFDFSGRPIWSRNIGKDYGKFAIQWLYGSSPMLYRGKLYVEVLERNPPAYSYALDNRSTRESYLLCIDPATGKDLWRHIRPTDAQDESMEAYSTPIPFENQTRPEILLVGGNYITGHNPDNGDEYWRCDHLNTTRRRDFRIVPSPVSGDGMVFACGPKGMPVLGIRAGGTGTVDPIWQFRQSPSDWSTPLFYRHKLFVLDGGRRVLSCLDPLTGAVDWQRDLESRETFWSSPTGADGKIYCLGERGTVVVLDAEDNSHLLASIPMNDGPSRSSIAVAHEQLFIRTAGNLFCVGKP